VADKVVIAEFDELSEAERAVMVLDRAGFLMAQVSMMAEGLGAGDPAGAAETYAVVVEGDAGDASRAREMLKKAEAGAVEVDEEG
jgi:hypothetical protein